MNHPCCFQRRKLAALALLGLLAATGRAQPGPLPGTQPLTMSGDIASNLVAGVDRFLTRKLVEAVEPRSAKFKSETGEGVLSIGLHEYRMKLERMLGLDKPGRLSGRESSLTWMASE